MQHLRHHEASSGRPLACVVPAGSDADKPEKGRENFPVLPDRLPRERLVRDTDDQRSKVIKTALRPAEIGMARAAGIPPIASSSPAVGTAALIAGLRQVCRPLR